LFQIHKKTRSSDSPFSGKKIGDAVVGELLEELSKTHVKRLKLLGAHVETLIEINKTKQIIG
jgi:hypothetical protein